MGHKNIEAYSLAEDNLDIICQLRLEGGRKAVADFLNVPLGSVGHILDYFGLVEHIGSGRLSAYSVERRIESRRCTNPFLADSFTKWYLLGYITGDGCITYKHGVLGRPHLNISSSDREHLELLASKFGDSVKLSMPIKGCYGFNIYDLDIVEYIIAWGIVPRKSAVGCVIDVPKDWLMPYMLGLLDSDGSIRKYGTASSLSLSWVGHPSYIEKLHSNIVGSKFTVRNNLAYLGMYGKNAYSFGLHMWDTVEFCLERKRDKFYAWGG